MLTRRNRRVAFRVFNGKFICAYGGGGGQLVASADAPRSWETFTLVDLGNSRVALQAPSGHYVCAENNGAENLNANRTAAAEWETFTIGMRTDGRVTLRAVNGKYVSVLGGGVLRAQTDTAGESEMFHMYETKDNRRVRIKASNGRYVCADKGGGSFLIADRDTASLWETFTLVHMGYNKVALQTFDGRFVQALNGSFAASAGAASTAETFRFITLTGGGFALQATNGQYVSSENGGKAMSANRTAIGSWEIFTLEESALSWEQMGGPAILGAPAVVSNEPGSIWVFVRGADEALWTRNFWNGKWGEWVRQGYVLHSDPVAATWGPGRIDVFFRGEDDSPCHVIWNGVGFDRFESLGGKTNAPLAAAALGSGRLRVYHRGLDNLLYEKCYENGGWGGWQTLDGYLNSGPTATCRQAEGRLDVFLRGMDDGLWHKNYSPADEWNLGRAAPGPYTSAPSVCTPGTKQLAVFARGWDGSLHMIEFNGNVGPGWRADVGLGGGVTSQAAALPLNGGLELFARGSDGGLIHARLDEARWPVVSATATALSTAVLPVEPSATRPPDVTVPTGWMAQIPGIADKTLADICIPHTHDSGTYFMSQYLSPALDMPQLSHLYPVVDTDWLVSMLTTGEPAPLKAAASAFLKLVLLPIQPALSAGIWKIVSAWGRAQGRSIGGQLNDGARWFDLRVCKVNGELRIHHGLAGPRIGEILDDVRDFVQQTHGEVILLEFSHLGSLSSDDHATLISAIVNTLGTDVLVPRGPAGTQISSLKFGTLTGTSPPRSRVIVIYSSDWRGEVDKHPQGNLIWSPEKDQSFYSLHCSDNKEGEMVDSIVSRQRSHAGTTPPAGKMVQVDWTYTPADRDVIITAAQMVLIAMGFHQLAELPTYGLEILTTINNAALGEWAKSLDRSSLARINRFNVDFPERSLVGPVCVAISNRDYDAINRLTVGDQAMTILRGLADQILDSLKRLLKLFDIGKLLREAAELVVGVLRQVPGLVNGATSAVTMAVSLGFSEAVACYAVASEYILAPAQAAKLFTNSAEAAARMMRDTFERPAGEVYSALLSGWGASEQAAREIMGAAGFAAGAIDDAIDSAVDAVSDFVSSLF